MLDIIRVGDKLISKDKLKRSLERILSLRASGLSQQEVANRFGLDRPFISRLEALAEIRKGGSLAIVGFPIGNKEEVLQLCQELGVDTFIMTDAERWEYTRMLSGVELLNELMGLIANLHDFDTVIMIGSDMRIRLAEAVLGDRVIGIQIGESPIQQDVILPLDSLSDLILNTKGESS